MPTRDALLAGILEHPDDDGPRLVYADWLDDHGDPDRAEFVRTQCQLAHLDEDDPARPALELRAQDLLTVHRDDWLEVDRGLLTGHRFERGFLHAICLDGPTVLAPSMQEDVEGLFASAPVRHLSLRVPDGEGLGGTMAEFLALPFLPRLARLSFWGGGEDYEPWLNDRRLPALADSAVLAGLTALTIQDTYHFTSRALGRLAKSPHLARLTELVLRETGQDDISLKHLAQSRYLTRLEALDLAFAGVGPDGLQSLLASDNAARLRRLGLEQTEIEDEGALLLASSPRSAALEALDLFGCGVTDEGVSALARSPHLHRLRRFSVGNADVRPGVGDAGLAALAELPALQSLSVPWGRFTAAGLSALAASPLAGRLTELVLYNTALTSDDYLPLVTSTAWPRLRRLMLAFHKGDGVAVVRTLGKSAKVPHLHTLDLSGSIGLGAAVRALVKAPLFPQLRVLRISGNGRPDGAVKALAEAPRPGGLLELDLGSNTTAAGLLRLATSGALPELRRLRTSAVLSAAQREQLQDHWGPRFRLVDDLPDEDFP